MENTERGVTKIDSFLHFETLLVSNPGWPDEEFESQYGHVTYMQWLKYEQKRLNDRAVNVDICRDGFGKYALIRRVYAKPKIAWWAREKGRT